MWVLVLLAIHVSDPSDVPGRIRLEFRTEEACRTALNSMTYQLKFDRFKITGSCERLR
jgi:hypothetical protein